ncbi:MAG: hypothetical protein M3Z29_13885 [Pseudomonadota bacterium]|nr:hypothetical protein [Pseudomonadota bacterium]
MAALPERVIEALRRGDTAEAIKRLRAVTPLDPKAAHDVIDAHRRGEVLGAARPYSAAAPAPRHDAVAEAKMRSDKSAATERLRLASGFGLAQAKDASDASRFRDHPTGIGGRSPGEVPNSGRLVWWIVISAVAAYAAYAASGGRLPG